jgi:single-stranded DNA-binding protein
MNMVILSGNIGVEPDFRQFEDGRCRVSFSVACDQYNEHGERIETLWLLCCAWNSICERLKRCQSGAKLSGRKINVTGQLLQRTWDSSGQKKTKIFVDVISFELLPWQSPAAPAEREQQRTDAEIIFDGTPLYPSRTRFRRRSTSVPKS